MTTPALPDIGRRVKVTWAKEYANRGWPTEGVVVAHDVDDFRFTYDRGRHWWAFVDYGTTWEYIDQDPDVERQVLLDAARWVMDEAEHGVGCNGPLPPHCCKCGLDDLRTRLAPILGDNSAA